MSHYSVLNKAGEVKLCGVAVYVIVGLDVTLADYENAVLVAHVVEHLIVGIVSGSDGVDVEVLHLNHIGFLKLPRDISACFGVVFVSVDSLELHRLAVEEYCLVVLVFGSSYGRVKGYLSEAELLRNASVICSLAVIKGYDKGI